MPTDISKILTASVSLLNEKLDFEGKVEGNGFVLWNFSNCK
jgi:hypothetical protein